MDPTNPNDWSQAATAVSQWFNVVKTAVSLMKEARGTAGVSETEQRALDAAINQADTAAKLAEAQLAQALGYQLCRCELPPTAMLAVGYRNIRGTHSSEPVHECPKCGMTTAGGWTFTRTKPKSESGME